MAWRDRWALALAAVTATLATAAQAQDDGPRVYQLAPVGAQALTIFAVAKRGDEEPEVGSVLPGSDIDTNVLVFRYVRTFDLAGLAFSPFVILPTGRVTSTTSQAEGGRSSQSSAGLGDMQLGATLGLIGAPALTRQQYAAFKPGFGMSLFARVFFPTGAYSDAQPVNLGANRVAFQIGLPMTVAFGSSYRDPSLTTADVLPTLTFYEDNPRPFGAQTSAKGPLFTVEAHLTHNLNARFWVSADLLYRQGGETTTDGVADANATRGWSAGGSAAFVLTPKATLIFTYEEVIERSDNGPYGGFFRTALVLPF